MNKVQDALAFIEKCPTNSVVFTSFGKDSIVMLDLVRKVRPDVEVLYFRQPFFPHKHRFANRVIDDWELQAYDYPPTLSRYIQEGDFFDVCDFYYVTPKDYYLMVRGCKRDENGICIHDILNVPKVKEYSFKWDCAFIGQKECDKAAGYSRQMNHIALLDKKMYAFPLKDWTDQDVWDYIGDNNLPINEARYLRQEESLNEDILPTCNNCMDYRNKGQVYCPKLKRTIMSVAPSEQACKLLLDLQVKTGNFKRL
jgi:3'-phosphoadenosine 5'-phosphosulfate sulfotransferase (PAPS reductase)/FAD synthetase